MIRPTKTVQILVLCLVLVVVGYALARGDLLRGVATWGVFLLCPLMHVGMMLFMGHNHSHGGKGKEDGSAPSCHSMKPDDGDDRA